VTLAGICLGAVFVLAVPPLREALLDAVRGDTASVRDDLRDLGGTGVLLVFALAMIHAVVFYPAEILNAAAGFVYGFGLALPMIMVFWLASGLLAYAIGRHAARPTLYRLLGQDRFLRLERLVERGGVTFLLAARLVPIVPFSLMCYVAGAARVPLVRFAWTTAVGYLPITAYFVYLGTKLEGFSLDDPILWIGAFVLIGLLAAARWLTPVVGPKPETEG
jgi:uncharacterized membrane protein YdjX (TVP38/TMEM64 family)